MSALCRAPCCATSSRVTIASAGVRAALACRPTTSSSARSGRSLSFRGGEHISEGLARPGSRALSLLAHRPPLPFFTPPPERNGDSADGTPSPSPEEEVDDGEWEMRVARAMLHLRESLPLLFADHPGRLFPEHIYSKNLVLRLQHPFPLKMSGLHGYGVAFKVARNGMQALHTDLSSSLERMTFSPAPAPSSPQAAAREALLGRAPTHRQKQIRVLLTVTGKPRLPPHKEATWHTSSLYTFSPYSGLIASHEVETIRPLPGEGVGEWLMKSLLGWTGRADSEGAIPCPTRAVEVEVERGAIVRSKKRDE